MKLSLRLIASLVISISLVTFIVARSQVRSEKLALRADLARRAEILTESLQEAVEPVLLRGPQSQLQRMVDRFGDREHLAGVAVYDPQGKVLAASARIEQRAVTPPEAFSKSVSEDQGIGGVARYGQSTMYVADAQRNGISGRAGHFQ
jgi:trehalose 6-phosphate synthase